MRRIVVPAYHHNNTHFFYEGVLYPKNLDLLTPDQLNYILSKFKTENSEMTLAGIKHHGIYFSNMQACTQINSISGSRSLHVINFQSKRLNIFGEVHASCSTRNSILLHQYLYNCQFFRNVPDKMNLFLETNSLRNKQSKEKIKESFFSPACKHSSLLSIRANTALYYKYTLINIDLRIPNYLPENYINNKGFKFACIQSTKEWLKLFMNCNHTEFLKDKYINMFSNIKLMVSTLTYYKKTLNKYRKLLSKSELELIQETYLETFCESNVKFSKIDERFKIYSINLIHMDLLCIMRFHLSDCEENTCLVGSKHATLYSNYFKRLQAKHIKGFKCTVKDYILSSNNNEITFNEPFSLF